MQGGRFPAHFCIRCRGDVPSASQVEIQKQRVPVRPLLL
jgi:hypothetical protein